MTSIEGIQPVSASRAIQPTEAIAANHAQVDLGEVSDVVDISTASILAAKIHEMPDVRADLVAEVKAQIAAGTYETQQRLEIAVERLTDELLDDV